MKEKKMLQEGEKKVEVRRSLNFSKAPTKVAFHSRIFLLLDSYSSSIPTGRLQHQCPAFNDTLLIQCHLFNQY